MDVDGTLCPIRGKDQDYGSLEPFPDMVQQLREYRDNGFYIIIYSARNMRTHDGNVGRIVATTGKTMMAWLDRHQIPYDEIHLGKPWPGRGGFYVDDRTIRPDEFLKLDYAEILALIGASPGGD
jgi:capsule biosynthesis phosphatase